MTLTPSYEIYWREVRVAVGKNHYALIDKKDLKKVMQHTWYYSHGYAISSAKTGRVWMHRLINKTPEGFDTDHKNGNRLDNRRKNLRTASKQQNAQNRNQSGANRHGYKGVTQQKDSRKYEASIKFNQKSIYLGSFETVEEAASAYNVAARKYFGEYAALNQIKPPKRKRLLSDL